ncbi:MAG TPA: HYR domain-containing protein, partial [Gemmatimonadaceae bacterium]|nr:HYR domain-containing protein [Gemmatimonadaceae bacterium]
WTTARAPMPTPRQSLGAGVVNGVLYAVGGFRETFQAPLATVEAYDPATNSWTTKAPMPTARHGLAVAVVNGILYAMGGSGGAGALATVEAYDPATNSWSTKASMPTPRSGLGAAAVSGVVYAVGGSGGASVLQAYDPAANTWTTRAPMPTARHSLAAAELNGLLYAVGGTPAGGGATLAVEAYDPATNGWTSKAPLLTARDGLAAAAVNGFLYAVGGGNLKMEIYDPATDSWSPGPNTVFHHRGLGVGLVNGILYAVGGFQPVLGAHGILEALVDLTRPVVTPPADLTVNADPGQCSANPSPGTATATDERDGPLPVTAVFPVVYPVGTTTIVWTATDAAGNKGTAVQKVTVRDTEAPSIAAPADVAVNTEPGKGTATVDPGTPTAADNCSISSVNAVRSDPQPFGAPFPAGTTTITWTAKDPSGNTAVATQTISVKDVEPPAVSVPASYAVNATGPGGAVVTFGATATDNVAVDPPICTPPSGSLLPIGTTTVSCTASDAAGNSAAASFAVTVKGAAAQIPDLRTTVEGLDLQEGTETSLKAKLDAALASLVAGNTSAACGQLDAMINQITAQIDKKITQAHAQTLIDEIDRIRAVIGC